MNKYRVIWVPGYDHAGIATQGIMIYKELKTFVILYLLMFQLLLKRKYLMRKKKQDTILAKKTS